MITAFPACAPHASSNIDTRFHFSILTTAENTVSGLGPEAVSAFDRVDQPLDTDRTVRLWSTAEITEAAA